MTLEQDQALVRAANEQRKARTWAETWNDVAWLQQRVTELERWHVNQASWHIDQWNDDNGDCVVVCRGEHGPEDGCEWQTYQRITDEEEGDSSSTKQSE